jgi:hypothetical protein
LAAIEHRGVGPEPNIYYFDGDLKNGFVGQEAVDRYGEYLDGFLAKPDAEWLDLIEENIAKAFG